MILLKQLIVFFIIIIIGIGLGYKKIIDSDTSGRLSWIVVNIANPCLIISGSIGNEKTIGEKELIMAAVVSVIIFLILIILAWLVTFILRICKEIRGVYNAMLIFSNIGFMGFPIIESMYGKEALMYGTIFLIPFNILIYTYGIFIIRESRERKLSWRKIINPGTIACAVSLVIFITDMRLPYVITQTVSMLSSLTAPLCMMLIGVSLTNIKIKARLIGIQEILFIIIKMIVIPAVGMYIIGMFTSDKVFAGVCAVILASPAGSMVPMLAKQYGGDFDEASKIVAITTFVCIATMPLVFWITGC